MGKPLEVAYKSDWRSLYILTIVSFLGAFKIGTNSSNLWPYFTQHDNTMTESLFGVMTSVSNVGNLGAAFVAGWLSNQLQHTKPSILTGKVFFMVGAFIYLSVELVDSNYKLMFLAMEIFFGLGIGFSSVARTYVAMASSENSRARAFGIISLAVTCGHAAGPAVMAIMTKLKYPGYAIGSSGLHLNMYSTPIYLLIFTAIVSVILIIFCFDGKMRLMKAKTIQPIENEVAEVKKPTKVIDPSVLPKGQRFDILAVSICCATRLLSTIGTVYGHVLSAPYMMTTFRWSRQQFIFINSIVHTINGLIGVVWSLIFISGCLKGRLSERRAIVIAIIMKLMFFVVTYPWPFYANTIQYEVLAFNETTNKNITIEYGCKAAYEWCQYTPQINVYLYCISKILLLGVSVPLMHLGLEILYSKILGQIKQGTLQGCYIICGDVFHVIGPILLTYLYQHYGVKVVWILLITTMVVILGLWLVFYDRMISSSRRMQQIVDAIEMNTDE